MKKNTLTNEQDQFLVAARVVARGLGVNGRALTFIIGELSACELLGLVWSPQDGYDAMKGKTKYQIKARKNWTEANEEKPWWTEHKADRNGTMGRFGKEDDYSGMDRAVYVELDKDFEVWEIWEASISKIEEAESNIKRGLKVGKFKSFGKRSYKR
ncbi:hypothetical protein M1N56_06345 [Dehalococcoidia bacterium]|nr:hypothetical protein [Dehalococcoidia bacterium]